MFATYSLNIRRLLTQSIRRRPNLHVKSEHHKIIAEYLLAVHENCLRQCIFSIRVIPPNIIKGYESNGAYIFSPLKFIQGRKKHEGRDTRSDIYSI